MFSVPCHSVFIGTRKSTQSLVRKAHWEACCLKFEIASKCLHAMEQNRNIHPLAYSLGKLVVSTMLDAILI